MLLSLINKFCILLTIPLLTNSLFAQEIKNSNFKEKILLEDFESLKINTLSVQIPANTRYLPEIRLSKNLTSPDLQSNTSLLVRISADGTGIPFDVKFAKPYELGGYSIELEFHIYSNNANGELFLYLLDSKFQKHKIRIASLNYDGWKSFKIPIAKEVFQSDFILGKPSYIEFVGIQINSAKKETKDKEDLIAIDDIFLTKRPKYRLPSSGLEAFH